LIKVELKPDLRAFLQGVENLKSRQLPFATSLAINRTLNDAKAEVVSTMQKVFDTPRPFVLRGVRTQYSSKRDLRGRIYLEDSPGKGVAVDRVLLAQVIGGERRFLKFEKALQARNLLPSGMYAVPTKYAPRDAYGNVPGNFVVQVLAYLQAFGEQGYKSNMTRDSRGRKKLDRAGIGFFVGKPQPKLPLGIWERRAFASGSAIRPIFIFVKSVRYQKRLPFYEVVEEVYQARFPVHFRSAFDEAMRTAR
jgi:hypothetical protein